MNRHTDPVDDQTAPRQQDELILRHPADHPNAWNRIEVRVELGDRLHDLWRAKRLSGPDVGKVIDAFDSSQASEASELRAAVAASTRGLALTEQVYITSIVGNLERGSEPLTWAEADDFVKRYYRPAAPSETLTPSPVPSM